MLIKCHKVFGPFGGEWCEAHTIISWYLYADSTPISPNGQFSDAIAWLGKIEWDTLSCGLLSTTRRIRIRLVVYPVQTRTAIIPDLLVLTGAKSRYKIVNLGRLVLNTLCGTCVNYYSVTIVTLNSSMSTTSRHSRCGTT